ncbi:CaiB/BaiF CoA transferase family protein [Nocardia sp. NPDC004722]
MFATIGTLAAVHHRGRTGRGQIVDSAIYEAVLAMMESLLPEWGVTGYQRERTGPVLPNVSPSNVYPTAGGELILIAANQDTVFARLAKAMGQPQLMSVEHFATHSARGEHMAELDAIITGWTATRPAAELLELLHAEGVPAGRIYTARDMFADPHFAARAAIVRLAHPELGEVPMQNVFPKLSETPGSVRHLGPELGEHNAEVYGRLLGVGPERLTALAADGIV